MKKTLLKAFTLIELIIVISIITLITTSSVFYFLDFVNNQEIKQKIQLIENDLLELDKEVKNYKTFDYQLEMDTSTLSWKYIVYKNIFDLNNTQKILFNNSNSFTWTIRTSWDSSFTWTLKLYKDLKLFLNTSKTWSVDYNFNFNEKQKYKMLWTLSWEVLNEIDLNYYSINNLNPNTGNTINLTEINTQEDKNWSNIDKLIITNIGWDKKFYSWSISTTNQLSENQLYLFFKNKWIEKFIKITK